MKLQYVATDDKVANVFTKPLSRINLEYFKDKIGTVPSKGVIGGTHPT